jgi:hypothetical protein
MSYLIDQYQTLSMFRVKIEMYNVYWFFSLYLICNTIVLRARIYHKSCLDWIVDFLSVARDQQPYQVDEFEKYPEIHSYKMRTTHNEALEEEE